MKIIKKILLWTLIIVLILLGIFGLMWAINAPEDLNENSETIQRLETELFALDSVGLKFVDTTRSTPALGDFPGDDERQLKGTVWFPKGDSKDHPLLVFSHGFNSYHKGSRHIAQYLAKNGYIVAAVDFPLSNAFSPAGNPQLLDIVNQPGDISAVIDHMLALNADKNSSFYQRLDADKIGVYGLSLGGLTTALVSFHPDYLDTRVQAAAMMAPPLETFSDAFYASNPNVSSLILSGSLDLVVPEKANASEVIARNEKGWFLSFEKGSHLGFANVSNPLRWMNNPDDFGCAVINPVLEDLELPERWSDVLPNTNNVIRDVVVPAPCPEIPGQAMNGLKQQWLTRVAIGAFFDMNLRSGERAQKARAYFTSALAKENDELSLTAPR